VPVEMWKTDLNCFEHWIYISTGIVENLWKIYFPVENFDKKTLFPHFHRQKKSLPCGNVENFF
jgi:hypothetical protein